MDAPEHPEPRRRALQQERSALSRLRAAAERAKTALSSTDSTLIHVSSLPGGSGNDLELELTRLQLDSLTSRLVTRTIDICRRALADAKMSPSSIDEILMVGGQTRMPQIRATVAAFFGKYPNVSINPDEVVALGAAVQAAILTGQAIGLRPANAAPSASA